MTIEAVGLPELEQAPVVAEIKPMANKESQDPTLSIWLLSKKSKAGNISLSCDGRGCLGSNKEIRPEHKDKVVNDEWQLIKSTKC